MRRLLLLLTPLIAFALAACGGAKPTPAPAGSSGTSGNNISIVAVGGPRDPGAPPPVVAAPPAAPEGVTLENVSHYLSGGEQLVVIGEIVNTSRAEARNLTVTVELLDDAGQPLTGISLANPGLPVLKPGEKTVWRASLDQPGSAWKSVRTTLEAGQGTGGTTATYVPLNTEGIALTPPGKEGWVKGTGRVLNGDNAPIKSVAVLIGLYDADGRLLDVGEVALGTRTIPANGATTFNANFRNTQQVPGTYKVFAAGYK